VGAPTGLDADDAFRRQGAPPDQELGVLPRVDVVGDHGHVDLLAEPQAPAQEKIALRRDLGRALDQLSPRCRDLLRLRYGMGMRPGEVAAQLDYRPSSIRKVVGRCQLVLCEQLLALGYPVKPRGVTSTDIMITASGLLKSQSLAVFELGMWQSWTGR